MILKNASFVQQQPVLQYKVEQTTGQTYDNLRIAGRPRETW